MLVLKIKSCLVLLTVDAVLSAATTSQIYESSTPSSNLSHTSTTFQTINGSVNRTLDLGALNLTTHLQSTKTTERNDERIISDTQEDQEKTQTENDESLFDLTVINDYPNVTTESWDFDINDLQNTSVEDIFKTTNEIFNKTIGVLPLNEIIQKWLLEQKQAQNRNETTSDTLIENVKANGIFSIKNATTLVSGSASIDSDDGSTSLYDTTEKILTTDLTSQLSTVIPTGITEIETSTSVIFTDTTSIAIESMTTFRSEETTPRNLKNQSRSDVFTEVGSISTTENNGISSTTQNKLQSTSVTTIPNDDRNLNEETTSSSIFGSLQNEDGDTCVSLNCSIQIYIKDTPINIPQNLSIMEVSSNEEGLLKFKWFDNSNNSIIIIFHVRSKEEYCYIHSIAIGITNVAAFVDDVTDQELNVDKQNMNLFKTKIGTSLKIDRDLLVPIGEGVVLYLFKVRFSVLQKLGDVGKLSSASFSDYFVEVLGVLVGLTLLSIIVIVVWKKYRPVFKKH